MARDGGDGEGGPGLGQPLLGADPLLAVELLDALPREHRRDALHQDHLVAVRLEPERRERLPTWGQK